MFRFITSKQSGHKRVRGLGLIFDVKAPQKADCIILHTALFTIELWSIQNCSTGSTDYKAVLHKTYTLKYISCENDGPSWLLYMNWRTQQYLQFQLLQRYSIVMILFIFILIRHYQSTAGDDLSILFTLQVGFEPTLPRWLSAGWKGYYISYDIICICTVKVIHWIAPLSRFTGHRHLLPIDFHTFFSHVFACTVSPSIGHLETIVVASHC